MPNGSMDRARGTSTASRDRPVGTVPRERPVGATGPPGTLWFTGPGLPSDSVGRDGDLYLDTTTGDVYRKTEGTWF